VVVSIVFAVLQAVHRVMTVKIRSDNMLTATSPKRPAPRNKRQSTPAGDIVKKEPKTPQPAKRGSKIDADGDMIMTSNSGAVLVPPSPGVPGLPFGIYSDNPVGEPKNKSRPSSPLDDRTAAGVKKAAPKKKILTEKVVDAAVVTFTAAEAVIDKGPFRFLDLPGGTSFLLACQCTY
jgi:hypothetical protein